IPPSSCRRQRGPRSRTRSRLSTSRLTSFRLEACPQGGHALDVPVVLARTRNLDPHHELAVRIELDQLRHALELGDALCMKRELALRIRIGENRALPFRLDLGDALGTPLLAACLAVSTSPLPLGFARSPIFGELLLARRPRRLSSFAALLFEPLLLGDRIERS